MRRGLIIGIAALSLGGCASLLPAYNAEIYRQLGQANDALAELRATVELPGTDTSYPKLQPYYIRIFAGLDGASTLSATRADTAGKRLFGRPAKIASTSVANCKSIIENLRQANERRNLIPMDFVAHPATPACAIPKLIEGDLNRSTSNG